MIRAALIALSMTLAATPAFAQKGGGEVEDQVIGYHETDARMNRAIEQARAVLPLFMAEFRGSDAPGAFSVKAGLPTADGGREHIWIGDLRLEDDQLVGNLANEPVYLPGMRLGSRVVVLIEDISDWTINTPDGVYGGYTTRVMLEDMSPAEAQRYRDALHLTAAPLPSWWTQ